MPKLAVMTWNVENLFRPGRAVSPRKTVARDEFEAKLDFLATVIAGQDPDVVALQELGGDDADVATTLRDLAARLHGRYRHQAMSNHPDGRGIRVGFLSRFTPTVTLHIVDFPADTEFAQVPDWKDKPDPFIRQMGRGGLLIEIEPAPGERVSLVALHLKSKLISYPSAHGGSRFAPRDENERARGAGLALVRRTAEAVTVRTKLNAFLQPADRPHVIVLGDLNDEPRAATTQLLLGPEDADAGSADALDGFRLYDLVDSIPMRGGAPNDKRFVPGDAFSRVYQGGHELIDHILVGKSLLGTGAELRAGRWRVKEVKILVETIEGTSVGPDPGERVGAIRPDHAPVYARFEW